MRTPEPRYNPENDTPNEPEVLRRCDDNLSPDCTDDGQFDVWDGHGIIHLCLACRRVYENREPSDRRIVNGPGGEGGVRFDRLWDQR